jgi:hypothetical protein
MCVITYSLEEGAVDPAERSFKIIRTCSSSSSASVLAASRMLPPSLLDLQLRAIPRSLVSVSGTTQL